MNEQIFGDTKDILESVDNKKEKVTNAKQRLKQEEANNENLIVTVEKLKKVHALQVARLANDECFIEKKKSSIIKFINDAREMYSNCQELHTRSTNQGNMLDVAFNGLAKMEASFVQAQSKTNELHKSLEEEYKNLCCLEFKKKENLNYAAIVSEEQKIHGLLANIQEIEGSNLEMECQPLQLMVAQNLTKYEELEAKLIVKKKQNNQINAEVTSLVEYSNADEGIIKKTELEITDLEENMTEIQAEINSLDESISSLSRQPQEDLDELLMAKQKSLEAARKNKSEKKQKYNELFERHQGTLNLAKQQCSDFETAISNFKQKIEISETRFTELKTEQEKWIKGNELLSATLKKYEHEIKYEKQKLKKRMKGEEVRPLFTKPNIPKPTSISKLDSVIASSKRNSTPSNWDSDGSMDADYNAFIQRSRKIKRPKQ
nr:unnamed protein product [Callosobruchus analis]